MTEEHRLPESGLLRLRDFLGRGKLIPLSRSTWWAGVASGRYPKPVHIGVRARAWKVGDLKALIEMGIAR